MHISSAPTSRGEDIGVAKRDRCWGKVVDAKARGQAEDDVLNEGRARADLWL
jgi:hypothetical protein